MNATARRDRILWMLYTDPYVSDRKRIELLREVQELSKEIAKAQTATVQANAGN